MERRAVAQDDGGKCTWIQCGVWLDVLWLGGVGRQGLARSPGTRRSCLSCKQDAICRLMLKGQMVYQL